MDEFTQETGFTRNSNSSLNADSMGMFEEQPQAVDPMSFISDVAAEPPVDAAAKQSVASQRQVSGSFEATQPIATMQSMDMSSDFSAVPPVATGTYTPPTNLTAPKEANKLREWETQHELELDVKSKKEVEEKQAVRQKGTEELQRWYEDKKQVHSKRKSTNRTDEQVVLEQRDAANQPSANPWERVASLIDQSTTRVEANADEAGAKRADVTRMKQILIQLKANPLPVT